MMSMMEVIILINIYIMPSPLKSSQISVNLSNMEHCRCYETNFGSKKLEENRINLNFCSIYSNIYK